MKASERRLLMILGVLAALSGGAILSQRLLREQQVVERQQRSLELRQMESRAMLAEVELWNQRLVWLDHEQPVMQSENQASETLLETLLAAASSQGLVVQKKQLHEPVTAAFYREVSVTLTVRGGLPSVFRWLHGLLAPESFRVVSELKISHDAQNSADVTATVRVSQLHAPAVADGQKREGNRS